MGDLYGCRACKDVVRGTPLLTAAVLSVLKRVIDRCTMYIIYLVAFVGDARAGIFRGGKFAALY